jgi:hypothetical protein
MENLTDQEFEQYWRQMFPITIRRFRYFGINPGDEDAMQLARIALLRALRDYDPNRGSLHVHYYNEFNSYVPTEYYAKYRGSICYPTWLVKAKKERRESKLQNIHTISIYHKASETHSPLYELVPDQTTDVYEAETAIAMQQALDMLASKVPKEYVDFFKMFSGFGYERAYTLNEIADMLGLKRNEAVNLYARARRAVREAISSDPLLQQTLLDVLYRIDNPLTFLATNMKHLEDEHALEMNKFPEEHTAL